MVIKSKTKKSIKTRKRKIGVSNKAIMYRLLPLEEQAILFCKTIGCCRFLWNEMLGLRKHYWDTEKISLSLQPSWFKGFYPFLNEVDSVKCDLNAAFKNFFEGNAKYPKFKSRAKAKRSFRSNNVNNSIKLGDDYITLPKIGKVKIIKHREAPSDWVIKSVTVSQTSDGNFYASVLFEYPDTPISYKIDETKAIGLDYKSDGFYVDSEGNEVGSPKYYRKTYKRLIKEQRKLSRMIEANISGYKKGPKGGRVPIYIKPLNEYSNYQKQLKKVNKIHCKIKNQRRDFCHKKAYHLAENYDVVCLESINLRDISNKGFGNGKATLDNGFGLFRLFLEYKMDDRGKAVVYVDKFFPSSQICNCCGSIHKEMKNLKIRTMDCNCGQHINRDYNAALNIKEEGLRILRTA